LAQNVHEFDLTLTRAEYEAFDEIGRSLGLGPGAWTFLRDLVR
jgi:hypothetical protein